MSRRFSGAWLVMALFVSAVQAETSPFSDWLRALSAADSAAQLPRVRHEMEEWIAAHPERQVELPEQIDALKALVEQLMRSDSNERLALGATVVNVSASAPVLSPVADTMDQTDIRNRDALRVKDAVDYMAGVSID